MKSINTVISSLLDRGSLPAAFRVQCDTSKLKAGDRLEWDRIGFQVYRGGRAVDLVVLAFAARRLLYEGVVA